MFRRISNSWELIKASAAVLRTDKELIVFPIVSAICVFVVTASFAFPMWLTGFFGSLQEGDSTVLGVVVAFLFYLVQYFVVIFANSALVGAATIRLRGGDPTLADGFRIAAGRVREILGYALISATVGMILRWVSEREGLLGRIVGTLAGMAWNIATFLVVPVLVVEGIGPIDAVKRSGSLLKKTWGEQIVGSFGIGLVFGLLSLLLLLVCGAIITFAVMSGSVAIVVLIAVILVLALVLLGVVNSALSGIYTAAVYQYAVTGESDGYFRQDMVQNAFRVK
jgi:hypothetical protein